MKNEPSIATRRDRRIDLAVAIGLVAVTLAALSPVLTHDFLLYDDTFYVTENAMVAGGLTWRGVAWAFTTTFTGNWHPLAWMSHMADVEAFGMSASGHHLTNLLIHMANTVLLFLLLRSMTRARWRSAVVAALFALHPLHVESVAWVAERKDVLSTLFWMLAIGAYRRYSLDPGASRYALVMLTFVSGLLSKPMVVTLPFVLLLLDYWPLARIDQHSVSWARVRGLLLEKVPLFVLAVAGSVVTVWAQRAGGNVADAVSLPVATRIANSVVAYVGYLEKTVWPADLSAFYPHPATVAGGLSPGRVLVAVILLLAVSVLTVVARGHRYLFVGWLWFLGTLVPVIGLVQVGQQGMADRYTYIPLIGVFIMTVWGVADLVAGTASRRKILMFATAGLLAICALTTRVQAWYWRDTVTLFEHALRVTDTNRVAHLQLGAAYAKQVRYEEAAAQYRAALAIKPSSLEATNNLGIVLAQAGRPAEAAESFRTAIRMAPENSRPHANLARALRQLGAMSESVAHYRDALRLEPTSWELAMTLAWILATDTDPAVRSGVEAVELAERADRQAGHVHPKALDALAAAYAEAGRFTDAATTADLAARAAWSRGDRRFEEEILGRAALYRSGRPFRVARNPQP